MPSFTMKERKYWPKAAVAMAPSTLRDRPFFTKTYERGKQEGKLTLCPY